MTPEQLSILIKSWELFQNLAKGFGENSWKIRSVSIGFWATILAFAYKKSDPLVIYASIVILIPFFFLEAGTRIFQNKYIEKSVELERTLNDYLVCDDSPRLPKYGITTNIDQPNFKDFFQLFKLKKWMFWFPYLLLIIMSIFTSFFIK